MIPQNLVRGSRGASINTLLAFLSRFLLPSEQGRLQYDGVFGFAGEVLLRRFQKQSPHAIRTTGELDAPTRAHMKQWFNFDFEEAARSTGGTTIFVQPDGSEIEWSPAADAMLEITKDLTVNYDSAG